MFEEFVMNEFKKSLGGFSWRSTIEQFVELSLMSDLTEKQLQRKIELKTLIISEYNERAIRE